MVICLERGADLHMAQLMPLPLTVSCSSKIQIKRVCVCSVNMIVIVGDSSICFSVITLSVTSSLFTSHVPGLDGFC